MKLMICAGIERSMQAFLVEFVKSRVKRWKRGEIMRLTTSDQGPCDAHASYRQAQFNIHSRSSSSWHVEDKATRGKNMMDGKVKQGNQPVELTSMGVSQNDFLTGVVSMDSVTGVLVLDTERVVWLTLAAFPRARVATLLVVPVR